MRFVVRKERQGAFAFDRERRFVFALSQPEAAALFSGIEVLPQPLLDKGFAGFEHNYRLIQYHEFAKPVSDYCLSAPNRLYLELTRRCNLRCRMCYNQAAAPLPDELNGGEWRQLLDEMSQIGVFESRLTGGEPTMHPDFFRILDYAIAKGFYVSLATNGVWNAELLSEACKRKIDDVIVSLDGPEEINDWFRSGGSYQTTVNTMRALKLAGIPKVRMNTVLSRANWQKVEPLFRLAADLDLLLIDFIHPRPFGRGAGQEARDLAMGAEETYQFNVLVESLRSKYPKVKVIMDFDLLSEAEPMRHPIVPRIHACPAGREFAFVSPQGNMFPCGVAPVHDIARMTPQERLLFIAGNVREESLLEIWHQSPIWDDFRDLGRCKPQKCHVCRFWGKRCFGTCPVGAYYATGSLAGEDPYCFSHLVPLESVK